MHAGTRVCLLVYRTLNGACNSTVCCALSVVYCLLSVVCVHTVCCVLCVVWCVLRAVSCAVCCVLCLMCCAPVTVLIGAFSFIFGKSSCFFWGIPPFLIGIFRQWTDALFSVEAENEAVFLT